MATKSKGGPSNKPVDYSKQLEAIKKQGSNKSCFDCGEKGTTYVVLNFGTFVCSRCSGILRELNFKVKGTGVSIFTEKDIELINNNGNDKAKEIWMGKFNINRDRLPDPRKYEDVKQHIIEKYKNKKYYSTEEKAEEKDSDSDDSDGKKPENKPEKVKDYGNNVQLKPIRIQKTVSNPETKQSTSSSSNHFDPNDFQFPLEEKRQSDATDWGSIWGDTGKSSTPSVQPNQPPQFIQTSTGQSHNPFDIPFNNKQQPQPQQQGIPIQTNNNPFMNNNDVIQQDNQPQQRQMPMTVNPNQMAQGNSGVNPKDFSSLEKALFEQKAPNQPSISNQALNQMGMNPGMNTNSMQEMMNNPQLMMQMMMQNPQMMQMMMAMMNGQTQMPNMTQSTMNMPNMTQPGMNMPNMAQSFTNQPQMTHPMNQNPQINKPPLDLNRIFQDNSIKDSQSTMSKPIEKEDAFKDIYNFSQKALKSNPQAKPPATNPFSTPQVNQFPQQTQPSSLSLNQPPLSNSQINMNNISNQIPLSKPTVTAPSNNPFDFAEPSITTQPTQAQPHQTAFSNFQEHPQPVLSQPQPQQQNINQMGDYNPFNFL